MQEDGGTQEPIGLQGDSTAGSKWKHRCAALSGTGRYLIAFRGRGWEWCEIGVLQGVRGWWIGSGSLATTRQGNVCVRECVACLVASLTRCLELKIKAALRVNSLEEELEEDGTASSLAAMRESCHEVRATREETATERTELRLAAEQGREATVLEASILLRCSCDAIIVSRSGMWKGRRKRCKLSEHNTVSRMQSLFSNWCCRPVEVASRGCIEW